MHAIIKTMPMNTVIFSLAHIATFALHELLRFQNVDIVYTHKRMRDDIVETNSENKSNTLFSIAKCPDRMIYLLLFFWDCTIWHVNGKWFTEVKLLPKNRERQQKKRKEKRKS